MLGSRNAPLPQVNEPPTFATMNQTETEFVGVTRGILVERRKNKVRRKTWLPLCLAVVVLAACGGGPPAGGGEAGALAPAVGGLL